MHWGSVIAVRACWCSGCPHCLISHTLSYECTHTCTHRTHTRSHTTHTHTQPLTHAHTHTHNSHTHSHTLTSFSRSHELPRGQHPGTQNGALKIAHIHHVHLTQISKIVLADEISRCLLHCGDVEAAVEKVVTVGARETTVCGECVCECVCVW